MAQIRDNETRMIKDGLQIRGSERGKKKQWVGSLIKEKKRRKNKKKRRVEKRSQENSGKGEALKKAYREG